MIQKDKLLELRNDDRKCFKDLSTDVKLCLQKYINYVEMLCINGSWNEYPLSFDFIRDECIVRLSEVGIIKYKGV